MKLNVAVAIVMLTSACAGAPEPEAPAPPAREVTPPAPAAVDPVGVFDFTTTVEGMAVAGTITVTKTAAGYGGSIATNVTETIPVRSVVVEGQKATVVADTPDGPINFTMEFKGDEFTGTWTLGAMSGVHSGKRRKA